MILFLFHELGFHISLLSFSMSSYMESHVYFMNLVSILFPTIRDAMLGGRIQEGDCPILHEAQSKALQI